VAISKSGGRRPRGRLEAQILACLAAAGRPLAPGEVLEEIGGGLAYTTVMTTLARLHDKGVLDRRPAGRAYAYTLPGDLAAVRSRAVAQRMRRVLDSGHDRSEVLARFVADLTPEDERLLADLLADLTAEGGGGSAGAAAGDEPEATRE
jgi:predicted transcriptional regulator